MRFSRFTSLGLAALATATLAACATSTPYSAANEESQYGFTEQKIENNRYRITFRGNSLTERETVENYLLYRAAELTVEQGFDHFIVVSDDTEKKTSYSATRYPGPRYYGVGRPFPYYGWGYRWDPYYDDYDIREQNRYSAMAYVVMGKGEKPADTPTAYNAQEVLDNLGPAIQRPEID